MKILSIVLLVLFSAGISYAQLNPMASVYFVNPYLINPANAGQQSGWYTHLAFRAQWTAIANAPVMQYGTISYGEENRLGFGLIVGRESFGVFNTTIAKFTYAYHLPLDEYGDEHLDFGLSAGINNTWIDQRKVVAEPGDAAILSFNSRGWWADGDFGMAYRNKRLSINSSVPNLRRLLSEKTVRNIDDYRFSASIYYVIPEDQYTLRSVLMYRNIAGFRNMYDLGLQAACPDDKLLAGMILHSSGSVTYTIGATYAGQLGINLYYTSGTSDLKKYSNGEFEFALKLRW